MSSAAELIKPVGSELLYEPLSTPTPEAVIALHSLAQYTHLSLDTFAAAPPDSLLAATAQLEENERGSTSTQIVGMPFRRRDGEPIRTHDPTLEERYRKTRERESSNTGEDAGGSGGGYGGSHETVSGDDENDPGAEYKELLRKRGELIKEAFRLGTKRGRAAADEAERMTPDLIRARKAMMRAQGYSEKEIRKSDEAIKEAVEEATEAVFDDVEDREYYGDLYKKRANKGLNRAEQDEFNRLKKRFGSLSDDE